MTALYAILAILIFGLLVAIHEFGHFSAAKLCGVRVEEFAIGMGPALWKKQKGETLYSLRAVPFGGYCAMTGEDGESDDPRAFGNQKAWKRLLILVAGSFNNFLLGFLIVLILQMSSGYVPSPTITAFMDGCPYDSAEALQVGDRFERINGHRIVVQSDVNRWLTYEGEYDLELRRDGGTVKLENFRLEKSDFPQGRYFGFLFGSYEKAGFGQNLRAAWDTTRDYVSLVWESLRMLVHGQVGVNDLAGPVGIVDMMATTGAQQETTADALWMIFSFGAFIAVNLAVMNMLPIPALDGGRVFLLLVTALIEAVTRKKINPKFEGYIHAAGMVLLLALMAYVLLHDIFRLVTG